MMSMRRSLGNIIVRGKFFTNPIHTNYYTTRRIKGSYAFPRIFNSLHLSGYTECKNYHAEAKTKGGSDYSDEGKEEIYKREIRTGDTISLNDLLFTKNRDYLVKNNNQHVKAEQLEQKVIGIYFLPLSSKNPRKHSSWYTGLLKDIYDDLHPANNFEIVLVALACNDLDTDLRADKTVHPSLQSDSQKVFQDLFSYMPWTAIPFSDVTSRKHVQRSFGVEEKYAFQPIMYIVDQTGMVLQCCPWDIFKYYGALGYPFSDKRLKFLRTEDYLATQQPSLKTLLGSPQRDYIISNNGDKVPIHTFEDKIVAIYFYHPDYPDRVTEKLKLAYEEFANIKKIFEVVLVYIREPLQRDDWKSEESFWKTFKTMPWLAFPFKDMSYQKLKRVFELQGEDILRPRLVIFGPHANYVEPYGSNMLLRYGIQAFPFTRKKVAELEIEKVKELKLGMLWNPNTIFRRNDGSRVPFSQLFGKRVMLVLESVDVEHVISKCSKDTTSNANFLIMLKERYLQTKGTDDEFEVICILIDKTESYICKHHVGDMPWLVSAASELIHKLGSSYFSFGLHILEYYLPIFAFDLDGRLVRKTVFPKFEDLKFPFYAGGLEEEALSQLNTYFRFNYNEQFCNGGRIYT